MALNPPEDRSGQILRPYYLPEEQQWDSGKEVSGEGGRLGTHPHHHKQTRATDEA